MQNSIPFIKLVSLRGKIRFLLTFLVIALHAFFVGGIAFYRDYFAQPLIEGGTITVGIAATVGVIVGMILLEWFYIIISEKWFAPMQKRILEDQRQKLKEGEAS